MIRENVSIPSSTQRSRSLINSYAFVDLETVEEAEKALKELDEKVMQDKTVSVKVAKPIVPRKLPAKKAPKEPTKEPAKEGTEAPTTEKKRHPRKNGAKRERAPADMSPEDSIFIWNVAHGTTNEEVYWYNGRFIVMIR